MTRVFPKLLVAVLLVGACQSNEPANAAAGPAEAPAPGPAKPALDGAPVGSAAPDFDVSDEAGNRVRMADLRGKNPVLFAFYPKDFTSGWAFELAEFGEKHEAFTAKDVKVFGISLDDVESHRKFRAELGLPFPLLADTDGAMSKSFGALEEEGGQKGVARKLVLVDRTGKVIWRDEDYGVGDSAELDALLKAVAAL